MDWHAEWTRTQQELSAASRNEYWWKTLPEERRSILGRPEYRKQLPDWRVNALNSRTNAAGH